jgi:hypothetical protein
MTWRECDFGLVYPPMSRTDCVIASVEKNKICYVLGGRGDGTNEVVCSVDLLDTSKHFLPFLHLDDVLLKRT